MPQTAARAFGLTCQERQGDVSPESEEYAGDEAIDATTIQKYLGHFVLDPPSSEEVTMAPVFKAYADDHNGEFPKSSSDLLPYITTPEQKAAYQKLEQESPGTAPALP
jgi:hypothetical protein